MAESTRTAKPTMDYQLLLQLNICILKFKTFFVCLGLFVPYLLVSVMLNMRLILSWQKNYKYFISFSQVRIRMSFQVL